VTFSEGLELADIGDGLGLWSLVFGRWTFHLRPKSNYLEVPVFDNNNS
jgi:hypothetical protein